MDENNYKIKNIEGAYRRTADIPVNEAEEAEASRTFMNRVYNWMAGGLAVTALIAWLVADFAMKNPGSILWSPGFMLVMILVEFGLVIWLSAGIRKMSPSAASFSFLIYAGINGLTLSPIFLVYTQSAIYGAFVTCAGMFAATSIYGYVTRKDLSGVGSFCFMGLIGLIIASIVNMFIGSSGFDMILSYIGVAIFIGLTAWDTQKLKQLGGFLGDGSLAASDEFHKYAVLGALTLYLDFINLFLMLLRIFGGRRD